MCVPRQERADILSDGTSGAPRRRIIVQASGEVLAIAAWEIPSQLRPATDVFLCADEDHPASEDAVDHLLDRACRETTRAGPALIRLHQLPGHALTRAMALAHGFRPGRGQTHRHAVLHKAAIGRSIASADWYDTRRTLLRRLEIGLPSTPPSFAGERQLLRIESPSGDLVDVPLRELETLLSPVLFLLPDRGGVIAPIRRSFAEDLFGPSSQFSLLAGPEAALLHERAYFSSARTAGLMQQGQLMVFYESGKGGGRASAIAIARILHSRIATKSNITSRVLRRGVLRDNLLERMGSGPDVALTVFDNIMLFEHPVGLARLREIGCADRANLVTARPVTANQLAIITQEGCPRA